MYGLHIQAKIFGKSAALTQKSTVKHLENSTVLTQKIYNKCPFKDLQKYVHP